MMFWAGNRHVSKKKGPNPRTATECTANEAVTVFFVPFSAKTLWRNGVIMPQQNTPTAEKYSVRRKAA